jgi:hypothetical protein
MGTTRLIPREEWESYFERYTRRYLEGEGDVHADAFVEVMSPDMGDQIEATLVPVLGMDYDPKSNAFELLLENVDHLMFHPSEIAVVEDDDGFISALEVRHEDGIKEVVQLRRSAVPVARYEPGLA